MTDIPDDIMRTAREIVGRIEKVHIWKGDAVVDVAQAIHAERERCAQIADDLAASAGDTCGSRDVDYVIQCVAREDMGNEIATAIRQTRQETE